MKTIAIRVTDDDHKLFVALADREDMPLSSLVRRQLRALARDHGLLQYPEEQSTQPEPSKPRVIRRPIPQGVNAWRDEIYVRMNSGESAADIAESYGVSAQLVKDKYKAAKDDKQYHIDAGLPVPPLAAPSEYTPPADTPPADTPPDDEPELVYDPVDPDNPTEEEQAAHAEIARRRMIALGFKL